jgi:cell division protein FtsL
MGEKLMSIEVQFEKHIVNSNVIREADTKSHQDYIMLTALAAMFLLALFAYAWQHYRWMQHGYQIEEVEKKREQLSEIGRQLRLERATLRNPQRIDAIARGELGMVVPAPGQLVTISADVPLTIPAPQQTQQPAVPPAELAAQR